jgi:hypothetical protein
VDTKQTQVNKQIKDITVMEPLPENSSQTKKVQNILVMLELGVPWAEDFCFSFFYKKKNAHSSWKIPNTYRSREKSVAKPHTPVINFDNY